MAHMYSLFVRLGNGEQLLVSAHEKLEDAMQCLEEHHALRPGHYELRDTDGTVVATKTQRRGQS